MKVLLVIIRVVNWWKIIAILYPNGILKGKKGMGSSRLR